jgi:Domain of unknown function (DUF1824)
MDSEQMLDLLRKYTSVKPRELKLNQNATRSAILWAAEHSDFQILGICADSCDQGQKVLNNYLKAFGSREKPKVPQESGPVYIKFNPKTGNCTCESYGGEHRGVLVACNSQYDDDIDEMFGHLPLDLFNN